MLSATDLFLGSPLSPKTPLLSQLIFPQARGLPQIQGPLLTFSSPTGAQIPSYFLSSSFCPVFSFILPSYVGNLSYPFLCLRSSASVQQAICEKVSKGGESVYGGRGVCEGEGVYGDRKSVV